MRRTPLTLVAVSALVVAGPSPVVRSQPTVMEVVRSTPLEGTVDVRLDIVVRLEFSLDLDEASIGRRVVVAYSRSESRERGEAQPPSVTFSTMYERGARALVIQPDRALERFREVRVELLDGIRAANGAPLRPWTLTFKTGGS
ncbi:MAG: Ig-like domain-containing protein [Acidobacteriota bacterium]